MRGFYGWQSSVDVRGIEYYMLTLDRQHGEDEYYLRFDYDGKLWDLSEIYWDLC